METTSQAASGTTLEGRYETLKENLRGLGSVIVGFSGGVDSTFLLKVAVDVLGDKALAITAVSPSYPERDKNAALSLAEQIGAKHRLVNSNEFDDPNYLVNSPTRCFFCKQELFDILQEIAAREGYAAVAYGAITDDMGDFRPGMDAARKAGAKAPLLEAGMSKEDVREISRRLDLPTWNRPASACLSSRVPHGTPIDAPLLGRVESCEDFLIREGFVQVRVRVSGDKGETARIECAVGDLHRFSEPGLRSRLLEHFKKHEFRFVSLDLEGYRTGSLNPTE